jgi:uncharacterized protein
VVRTGDLETAELLVAAGADVNGANRYDLLPLHVAVSNGHVDLVRWLLAQGADPRVPDRSGDTPLAIASRSGELQMVEALLAHGADIDARDPHYAQTPLMLAVRGEHVDVVRRLLEAGADVDARTNVGEEPRFIMPEEAPAGLSRGIGIIRAGWPEHGKRYPIPGGMTSLLYSARDGNLEISRLLLEAGADPDIDDANGITPLISAILNKSIVSVNRTGTSDHLKIAELLVDAGADVNAQDWYGQTPLWAAVDIRNLKVRGDRLDDNRVDRVAAYALIERLLDEGADPDARIQEFQPERRFILGIGSVSWVDMTGQTPFVRAALSGDVRVMRLLIEHGADPNIMTFRGTSALMAAAGVNWSYAETFDEGPDALLEAVKLAHELGNDLNAVNSMGIGAIHGAANRGSNAIIEYLAANGAQLDVPDREGRTPMTFAEGVFLATHPPVQKPETVALLERLLQERVASAR